MPDYIKVPQGGGRTIRYGGDRKPKRKLTTPEVFVPTDLQRQIVRHLIQKAQWAVQSGDPAETVAQALSANLDEVREAITELKQQRCVAFRDGLLPRKGRKASRKNKGGQSPALVLRDDFMHVTARSRLRDTEDVDARTTLWWSLRTGDAASLKELVRSNNSKDSRENGMAEQEVQQRSRVAPWKDPEVLTRALNLLQKDSSECQGGEKCPDHDEREFKHGQIDVPSTATHLQDNLSGLSKDQVRAVNSTLGHLGLRWTLNMGHGRFRHFVSLEVSEITQQMVDELFQKERVASVGEQSSADEAATVTEVIDAAEGEDAKPAGTAAKPGNKLLELIQIMERLDKQNEANTKLIKDLRSELAEANAATEESRKSLEELQRKHDELIELRDKQIEELETRAAELQRELDDLAPLRDAGERLSALLSRHGAR